jgi:hypothetical protein
MARGRPFLSLVMARLDPAIRTSTGAATDGRAKPGHDEGHRGTAGTP